MNKTLLIKLIFVLLIVPFFAKAQTTDTQALEDAENTIKYPQFQFKGLLQARYLESSGKNVDVLGVQHSTGEVTQSSFDIKRMRVGLNTKLSNTTEVVILVNLADFKSDPKGKVLENAYGKYTFNKYIALTGGQFRPAFGIEELVPVDIIKSFDFSNQYYEFGKNGWTSFQIGASASGSFDIGKNPVSYAISILNGNGRNQEMDNDNGKQYSSRWVFELSKLHKINLGLNGGIGKRSDQKVFAVGADITSDFKLTDRLTFDLQIEYKQGTNQNLYFSLPVDGRTPNLDDYQMRGVYFLPNFRYVVDYKKLTSLELSCRFESFDNNFKVNSNVRKTYTPMISLEFGKAYLGRIEMGFEIDRFDKNIPDTSFYNDDLFIIQLQLRL
ncbi:OprO/OprP family phosphate-selective porin [Flavobacterium sp. AC]|uniref:OprO/OprP family phosphate-selective porin n=1 Tax=Flavobacterium azizsancarii TaxID=2961580 RepID=A0ABT4WAA5_9FLAO|nr:porin [Flavobacterium azizsancarii]MDA6069401.1 OprO/OprP family phosphate-selective porin [Flavobacterium azizsancarii]